MSHDYYFIENWLAVHAETMTYARTLLAIPHQGKDSLPCPPPSPHKKHLPPRQSEVVADAVSPSPLPRVVYPHKLHSPASMISVASAATAPHTPRRSPRRRVAASASAAPAAGAGAGGMGGRDASTLRRQKTRAYRRSHRTNLRTSKGLTTLFQPVSSRTRTAINARRAMTPRGRSAPSLTQLLVR